jgi:hypothetical protein
MKTRLSHVRRARFAHVLGHGAQRSTLVCLAVSAALVGSAQAKPRIDVGNHTIGISSHERIDVFVSGGDPLQGVDLIIGIADQGNSPPQPIEPSPADPGEPKIVSVDMVTGTIFDGNSTRVAPGATGRWPSAMYQTDQVWQVLDTTCHDSVPADGKIFTIILDTTGVALGSTWPLQVFGVLPNWEAPWNSNYSNWDEIAATFAGSNGSFTIAAPSLVVPEPASSALAVLAVVCLAAWGTANRRRNCTS